MSTFESFRRVAGERFADAFVFRGGGGGVAEGDRSLLPPAEDATDAFRFDDGLRDRNFRGMRSVFDSSSRTKLPEGCLRNSAISENPQGMLPVVPTYVKTMKEGTLGLRSTDRRLSESLLNE